MTGPWDKYGAPQGGYEIAPPDPYKVEDQQMQRENQARAAEAAQRSAAADARAAEAADRARREWDATHNPDGSRRTDGGAGNPLPAAVTSDFQGKVSALSDLERAVSGFKDDYSGFGAGIENTAQGLTGIGTPGQRDWWADFKRTDNITRNAIFGASLSAGERAAYDATTITPNMTPDEIRRNLERRLEIARNVLARQKDFLVANGYRKEAIDALAGPQQAPAPDAPMDQPAMAPATTEESVVDPSLTPVRRKYVELLQQGASGTQLVKFLRDNGITDPSLMKTAGEQAAFRRKNPNAPISAYDTSAIDHYTRQMSGSQQMLNDVGQSGAGAFAAAAGNAVTGNNLDSIIGWTGGNEEQARLALEYSARDNPTSALAGEIVGGTTAALGGEAALARAGMAGGFGRALTADSGYGALAGAGAADDGNRLGGAVFGGIVGGVASGVGQVGLRGVAKLHAAPGTDEARYLASQGVDQLSVGQALGGKAKDVEDKLTSWPLIGSAIKNQRRAGYEQFNTKAFDKALEPIGGKVGGLTGNEAVASAQKQASEAFNRALGGKSFPIDEEFGKAGRGPIERLMSIKRDNIGEEIISRLEELTTAAFDDSGNMSGDGFQAVLEGLREIRSDYAGDPMRRRIGEALRGFENAFEGLVGRTDPSLVPEFRKAQGAYRRLSILEDAVLAANNKGGVFNTSQLGRADISNTKKFDGKRTAAAGGSPFHEYQRAAQDTLPSDIPDSGTAGRLALMALPGIAGGGADQALGDGGMGTATKVGLGLTGALVLLYSRTGQRKLVERILKQNPELAKKLEERARLIGAGSSAAALGTTLDQ